MTWSHNTQKLFAHDISYLLYINILLCIIMYNRDKKEHYL